MTETIFEKSKDKIEGIRLTDEQPNFDFIDKMLNKGGCLIADDVLFFGAVMDETKVTPKNKTIVKNLKLFLREIKSNKNYESQIFDIEDGVSISMKVEN